MNMQFANIKYMTRKKKQELSNSTYQMLIRPQQTPKPQNNDLENNDNTSIFTIEASSLKTRENRVAVVFGYIKRRDVCDTHTHI